MCLVAQLCLTLCDPMDCSPPGSSVHGTVQAAIMEWTAMPSSRGSSWIRVKPESLMSPSLAGRFFTTRATWLTDTGKGTTTRDWWAEQLPELPCLSSYGNTEGDPVRLSVGPDFWIESWRTSSTHPEKELASCTHFIYTKHCSVPLGVFLAQQPWWKNSGRKPI